MMATSVACTGCVRAQAESLLNDGTAVVVFSILIKAVEHGDLMSWLEKKGESPAYIVWVAVRMSAPVPHPTTRRLG